MRIIGLFIILLVSCSISDDYEYLEKQDELDYFTKNSPYSFRYFDGLAEYTIRHNGIERQYLMYIPSSIESRENLPVIFNFHGYQGRADQFFDMTDLVEIADENQVVLVYPQGSPLDGGPSHWNAAPNNSSSDTFINKSNVNDLDFFLSLIEDVNRNNILDLDRVYAIGYSNGGMFAHFLACNTEDIFAAIGDVAGTMLTDTYNTCNPTSEIPLLKIHGTSDNVVSYYGLEQAGFKTVDEVINFWKSNNKSNDAYIFSNLTSTSWANWMGPVDFEIYTYNSESNNSNIVHYKMLRGGHWWNYSLDENLKTSELIWDFFSKHSK